MHVSGPVQFSGLLTEKSISGFKFSQLEMSTYYSGYYTCLADVTFRGCAIRRSQYIQVLPIG